MVEHFQEWENVWAKHSCEDNFESLDFVREEKISDHHERADCFLVPEDRDDSKDHKAKRTWGSFAALKPESYMVIPFEKIILQNQIDDYPSDGD